MIEIVGASSALQNCLLFVVLLVFFYFLARLYTPNERDLYYIACGHIFLTEAATDSSEVDFFSVLPRFEVTHKYGHLLDG